MTVLGVALGQRPAASSLSRLVVRDGWMVGAIWLAVTAYNLFKPYHIDDAAHLEIARWIAAHPLHPMSGTLNWHGIEEPIYLTNQPHLYFYLLALWGSLFGFGEATMHALQALFSLAAVVLFYRIAQCLVPPHAIWLAGMLAFSPSLAVEQNLMVDVPLLALWLLFFAALILGAGDGVEAQNRRFLVAGLACAGALLVKYSSLVLVVILVSVIVYERRWRVSWAVLVPLGILGAWSAFNVFDYGGIHIAQRSADLEQGLWPSLRRSAAWILTLGAITPFGLVAGVRCWPSLRPYGRLLYSLAALLFALLVAAVATDQVSERVANLLLRAAFFANAVPMVAAVAVAAYWSLRRALPLRTPAASDSRLMLVLLWIVGHLAFYSLFAPFMAVRHLLLVLPAVLLLGALRWSAPLPRADAIFGLAASLALCGALGWSDWRFAAFYRDEAGTVRATLPAAARVWFTGHWGWQWYAQQEGLSPVDVRQTELAPGDFLLVPRDIPNESIQALPPLVFVRTDSQVPGIGDLFCTAGTPGFYLTTFLESPWRLTHACPNEVDIYQVADSAGAV